MEICKQAKYKKGQRERRKKKEQESAEAFQRTKNNLFLFLNQIEYILLLYCELIANITNQINKSIFLQIVPQNDRRLRAIELSVPTVIATFQVKHRNSDGIIVDSRVYNIDLNSGTYVPQIYFFRQITTFIKVCVAYVFGLQTL